MRYATLFLAVLLLTPPTQAQDSTQWGGRFGLAIAGVEIDGYSRGMYGLVGGPELQYGRFRLRGELSLMLANKPNAEARERYGLCEDASDADPGEETCQELFGWGTGTAVFDVYAGDSFRFAVGAGADVGSHTGWHALGALLWDRWGLQFKGSDGQAIMSVFIRR